MKIGYINPRGRMLLHFIASVREASLTFLFGMVAEQVDVKVMLL